MIIPSSRELQQVRASAELKYQQPDTHTVDIFRKL